MKRLNPLSRIQLHKLLLTTCLPLLALVLQQTELLKQWDNQIFDAELVMFSRPANEDIVIIAIDENSLKKQGKWPWSRHTHAALINLLTAVEVKAIGLDIIFAEQDRDNPAADQALVDAVRQNGRVILPVLPEMSNADSILKLTTPWQELANAAAGLGHADVEIDNDGLVRSTYLSGGINGLVWPSFALALLTVDNPNAQHYTKGARNLTSTFSSAFWQRDYRIEIPFTHSSEHFRQISYVDALLDQQLRDSLRGKIVLIGMTATGLAQRFTTPMYKDTGLISGSEVNANVLDTLLNDLSIQPLNKSWSLLLTCVLVLIPVFGYNFFFRRHALLISLLFSALTIGLSAALLKGLHYWLSPMPILLVLAISYLLWNWQRVHFFTKSLFKERQLAKATLHSIAEAIITTDANGLITYMNPAAEQLTGFAFTTTQGLSIDSVVKFINTEDKTTNAQFEDFIHQLLLGQTVKESTPRYIINNFGDEYAVQINSSPIKGESKHISGAVFAFSDITETLHISSKITFLATHDPLTGLANRVLFYEQIEKAIATCHRQGTYIAVLFIDLDDFKKVNDGMGHSVGDLLLIEAASRLLTNARQVDTVARWGGDEFVVLLNHLPDENNITDITMKILQRLSQPYHFEGQTIHVTSSIGVSIFPKDGLTAEELLINADAALFQVKENGRNNISFFCTSFNTSAKERLEMEKELYCALDEDQFEVFYQPQINPKNNKIIGAEALLRWNHPIKGLIPPDIFIPLAEKTGLINQIGDWVLHMVCKQISSWKQLGLPEICIAVNFSPRQFLQHDLCEKINNALKNHHVDACFLKAEITESLMIKNIDEVIKTLWDIRALGVSISIDDFGTGYSSLSMLKNFPIDQLKIDKAFINHIGISTDSDNIAQSIIMLGHNMNMNVIAEGVETKMQIESLLKWNCDYIQGYYFSRPLTAPQMTALLRQGESINGSTIKTDFLN